MSTAGRGEPLLQSESMTDFVFIYGPPAVGKYTVAKELAAHIGYPLFHNHIAIDYVESVIPWGKAGFFDTLEKVRHQLASGNLANGYSLATTFAYAKPHDDVFVAGLQTLVKQANARFCAVRVTCSRDALFARIGDEHRAPIGKASSAEVLESILSEHECFDSVDGIESLVIDTDIYCSAQGVSQIVRHFSLLAK